jgi:YhcH/YjgK/YiaL family protein
MIVDHVSNLGKYVFVHPLIKIIIEYIREHDLIALPSGKTEIMGSDLYVLRETYASKKASDCIFEGHLIYGDLQLVLSGFESIGYHYKGEHDYQISSPYLAEKDIEKYQIDTYTQVLLQTGMFAIVLPDDLHMPKLMHETSEIIEKIVFKFKLSSKGVSSWQKL